MIPTSLQRRHLVLGLTAGMALGSTPVLAQDTYPSKPIRLVVPFAPGAITDTIARLVSERVSAAWGQPVVVDFKPGAGQQIGIDTVNKAPPDGYTVLLVSSGVASLAEVNKAFKLDVTKDLVPVTQVASAPLLLVAHPRFASLNDLIAFGRKDGRVNAGVSAVADMLDAQILSKRANFPQEIVRFGGAAPTLQAIAAGDVHYALLALGSAKGLADAGRVKILAVTGNERFAALPDTPTMAELGYPQVEYGFWIGLMAPPGTPQAIVDKLATTVVQSVQSADLRKRIADAGMTAKGTTPAEYTAILKREIAGSKATIREYGIQFQ